MTINYDFFAKGKNPHKKILVANLEISRYQILVGNLVCTDAFNTKISNWDTKKANFVFDKR